MGLCPVGPQTDALRHEAPPLRLAKPLTGFYMLLGAIFPSVAKLWEGAWPGQLCL